MKKFSVLLVAILALMMLFVSCEHEPEKRAATKEDGEIINGLIMSAMGVAASKDPVYKETVVRSSNEYEDTITFKKAEYKEGDNVVAVLNGTMTMREDKKTSTFSVDFGDGTKYKGVDHTLLANVVTNYGTDDIVSYEIMLDGVILTDFDFDSLSSKH